MSGRTEITIKTTSEDLAGKAIDMATKMKMKEEEGMEKPLPFGKPKKPKKKPEQEGEEGEMEMGDEKCGDHDHEEMEEKGMQDDMASGGMEAVPPVVEDEEEEEEGKPRRKPKPNPNMAQGEEAAKGKSPAKRPMSGKLAPSHNDDGEPTTEGSDKEENSKYMKGKGFSDVEACDFSSLQMKMLLGNHDCMPSSMEFISKTLRSQAEEVLGEPQASVGTFADIAVFVGKETNNVHKFQWVGGGDADYELAGKPVIVSDLHKSVSEILIKSQYGDNEEKVVQRLAVKALSGDSEAALILKRAAGICEIKESDDHKTILEFFEN